MSTNGREVIGLASWVYSEDFQAKEKNFQKLRNCPDIRPFGVCGFSDRGGRISEWGTRTLFMNQDVGE